MTTQHDNGGTGGGPSTGGLFTSDHAVLEDCKLVSRAARLGWDISPERRKLLLDRMFRIVETSEYEREAVAAAKAILMADTINQRREAAKAVAKAMRKANGVGVVNNTLNVTVSELSPDDLAVLYRLGKRLAGGGDGSATDEDRGPAPLPPP